MLDSLIALPEIYKLLILAAGAYALGCFSSSYYLLRVFKKGDVREEGSGTAGATNAGRILGKFGFMLVFILDVAKGILALYLADILNLNEMYYYVALFFVVLGHIFPVQLSFRGGKGLATCFGGMFYILPYVALLMMSICVILYLSTKSRTVAATAVVVLFPIASGIYTNSYLTTVCLLPTMMIMLYISRRNIIELFKSE